MAAVAAGRRRGVSSPLALIWHNRHVSSLPVLEDADLAQYSAAVNLHAVEAPLTAHTASFDAEATDIVLSVAAMENTEILQERRFVFSVHLAIDSSEHLWSDDGGALKAAVTFDAHTRRMNLRLVFDPAGKGAIRAAADAAFLRTIGVATSLALRMPNGDLAPDEIPVPSQFVVEDGLLSFLQLLAEVSLLGGVDIRVPEQLNRELANDLIVARSLLRGEEVRGKWHNGEFSLGIAALPTIEQRQREAEQHQFMIVAPSWLEVGGSQIYLGEIAQYISRAIIDNVRVDEQAGKVILSVSAPGGSADSTFKPIRRAPSLIEPNIVLPDTVFEALATEAARRGQTADQVAAALLAAQLPKAPRRRLTFAAVGASTSGLGAAEADEMLAEGFGRD
jgi:hypothetical protein